VNPNFRKVALIAASLGLLVSLFLALSPDDDEPAATTTTAAQTTTEATTTTAVAPGPESVDVNAASGDGRAVSLAAHGIGVRDPPAPDSATFVYVLFRLGLAPVQVLLGNVRPARER